MIFQWTFLLCAVNALVMRPDDSAVGSTDEVIERI